VGSLSRTGARDAALVALATACHVAAVLVLVPRFGPFAASLTAAVPVVAAGCLRGLRAGLLAGVLVYGLFLLLLSLATGGQLALGPAGGLGLPFLVAVGGVVGRLRDLTARLADELRARSAAEAKLREHARLDGALLAARTAAHEINNVLVPTAGYAGRLARDPRLPADLRAVAAEAAAGALEAGRILDRLQDLTRIEETDWGGGLGATIDLARSGSAEAAPEAPPPPRTGRAGSNLPRTAPGRRATAGPGRSAERAAAG
jgi:hypothetical protein